MAQALGKPSLIALSHHISHHKAAYYTALAQANRVNEITDWLIYFADTVLRALGDTQNWVEFYIIGLLTTPSRRELRRGENEPYQLSH